MTKIYCPLGRCVCEGGMVVITDPANDQNKALMCRDWDVKIGCLGLALNRSDLKEVGEVKEFREDFKGRMNKPFGIV